MGQTPLHVSAGYNRAEIVKFLLAWQGPEKVELEAKNMVSIYYSLLAVAFCVKSNLLLVRANILNSLQYGETPLHMAAKNGCNDAARVLLAHGAFLEAKANVLYFSFSNLYLVDFEMKYMIHCYLLVEVYAFVYLFMQNGMTPLHLAVWYSLQAENCDTVKTLLEYNADCSAMDDVILL